MARVDSVRYNGSGDIFLAFATGNRFPGSATGLYDLKMLPHHQLNSFFEAVAEALKDASLNALAAETLTRFMGHTSYALPLDVLQRMMVKYHLLN